MSAENPIIRPNDPTLQHEAGAMDEFIATDVRCMHLEQMGHAQWWIGVELNNGEFWHVNIGAKNHRVHGYAHAELDHYALDGRLYLPDGEELPGPPDD